MTRRYWQLCFWLGVNIKNKSLRCPQSARWERQYCCSGRHAGILWCAASQSVRSSHSLKMQEQLPRLSLSQWTPPSRAATSSSASSLPFLFPCHCSSTSNLSILFTKRHAKGRAADAADAKSFCYTRTTKPFTSWLPVCLSWGVVTPALNSSSACDLRPNILHQLGLSVWPNSSPLAQQLAFQFTWP